MLQIGCHLSSVKGFEHMGEEALSIGANTFQFFTRNPRGGKAKDIDPEDVKRFLELADEHHFAKLVAHAPYTLNPCSACLLYTSWPGPGKYTMTSRMPGRHFANSKNAPTFTARCLGRVPLCAD